MTLRWLQWATADLAKGLGGVEVHARSVARELHALGISASLSNRPADLTSEWDVIHTHGSAIPALGIRAPAKAIRIHTLHGTTLGRMAACHEWLWPGGYFAAFREVVGVFQADVVLAVHEELWLYKLARALGKECAVCGNGWDSSVQKEDLGRGLAERLASYTPFWAYIGRGGDKVKAVERVKAALAELPDLRLVAAPGDGFEAGERCLLTGQLSSGQIQSLLARAAGLVLTSRYEGLPLVVLEALSRGVPVVSTPAGGIKTLPSDLAGLFIAPSHGHSALMAVITAAKTIDASPEAILARALANQRRLPAWRNVAAVAEQAVRKLKDRLT